MNIKILVCLLGALGASLAGCTTHPQNAAAPSVTAGSTAGPLDILGKNLRQNYPPLDSYFITPVDLGTVKVFVRIDTAGYRCRVYALAKGKTHVGQVDNGTALAPPTLTEVKYATDHDIKVLFVDVAKIQTSPSPLPAGANPDLPAFTDFALINRWGGTLDTITVGTTATNQVLSALRALCPNAR